MSEIKPFCPYCRAEMELVEEYGWVWRSHYSCPECYATSPIGKNTVRQDARGRAAELALRRASPWHSVKEGLPQDGTICVVHGYSEGGAEGYGIAPCTMTGWSGVGVTTFEVTHWIPVPDVPKEAEK